MGKIIAIESRQKLDLLAPSMEHDRFPLFLTVNAPRILSWAGTFSKEGPHLAILLVRAAFFLHHEAVSMAGGE